MKMHKNKKVMDIVNIGIENDILILLSVFKCLFIVCIESKCSSFFVEIYCMCGGGRMRKV